MSKGESNILVPPKQHCKINHAQLMNSIQWMRTLIKKKLSLKNGNLKKQRLPSWAHTSSTGPRTTREKVRYCTVVTGDLLLLLLFRWDLDIDPVWEFTLTAYTVPCDFHSNCSILEIIYSFRKLRDDQINRCKPVYHQQK